MIRTLDGKKSDRYFFLIKRAEEIIVIDRKEYIGSVPILCIIV